MATYLNIMMIHSKKKYMFTNAHMCCIYVGLDRRNLNHVIMFITNIYFCIILLPANIFNNKILMSRGSCIVVLAREDKKST